MRLRALVAVAMGLLPVAIGSACSSKSDNEAAATVREPRPDAGNCTRACCELPEPGTVCTLEAGTTCSYAVTCPEGLVLGRTTLCVSSRWEAINDCPVSGGVDSRGCPAAQPAPDSPCSVDGGFATCSYTKTCAQMICDGSDCATVRSSANATCSQGKWTTTPLGPC